MCSDCGRVKPPEKAGPDHAPTCRTQRGRSGEIGSVFLYREGESDAIRILLPVAELDLEKQRASFKAALEFGLRRRYGGRAPHLRVILLFNVGAKRIHVRLEVPPDPLDLPVGFPLDAVGEVCRQPEQLRIIGMVRLDRGETTRAGFRAREGGHQSADHRVLKRVRIQERLDRPAFGQSVLEKGGRMHQASGNAFFRLPTTLRDRSRVRRIR